MVYIEVTFTLTPWSETAQDVLTALAGDIGFESFVEEDTALKAYIQQKLYSEEAIQSLIADFPIPDICINYSAQEQEARIGTKSGKRTSSNPL
jgi:ribosomal protein L11 methyltransferase